MTNGEMLDEMLRKTFPRTIFIRGINESNKTQSIVFSDEWLKMPYVQPEQKWIPVSELLPEENEEVLVTFKSDDEIRVYNCKYFDNSPWWKNYVIAWMPLPEPYKAESEDEG